MRLTGAMAPSSFRQVTLQMEEDFHQRRIHIGADGSVLCSLGGRMRVLEKVFVVQYNGIQALEGLIWGACNTSNRIVWGSVRTRTSSAQDFFLDVSRCVVACMWRKPGPCSLFLM